MSLAVLKRKTKETVKTKKGTFSLNGTKRNLSYVGKNYSAMSGNISCYSNSNTIKKSTPGQSASIRNRMFHSATDVPFNYGDDVVDGDCDKYPRPGTIQNICNNWVQRVEPDGNVSQGEYIKNKRIVASTTGSTASTDSDNNAMCTHSKRIGGSLYPEVRYVSDTTTKTSSEHISDVIANRGKICTEAGGGWQKPFPYTVDAGNTTHCNVVYKQTDQVIGNYYKKACANEKECP